MQQSPSAAVTQDAALDVPGRGDVVFVFLGIPLGHQETVIAAAAAGILAAYGGPGSIDGAATLVGIEELADLAEMLVGLAAHGIFRFFIHLGELLARRFKGQLEVLGQTLDVALVERDQGIRAAIARALRAIIESHEIPPESLPSL